MKKNVSDSRAAPLKDPGDRYVLGEADRMPHGRGETGESNLDPAGTAGQIGGE